LLFNTLHETTKVGGDDLAVLERVGILSWMLIYISEKKSICSSSRPQCDACRTKHFRWSSSSPWVLRVSKRSDHFIL